MTGSRGICRPGAAWVWRRRRWFDSGACRAADPKPFALNGLNYSPAGARKWRILGACLGLRPGDRLDFNPRNAPSADPSGSLPRAVALASALHERGRVGGALPDAWRCPPGFRAPSGGRGPRGPRGGAALGARGSRVRETQLFVPRPQLLPDGSCCSSRGDAAHGARGPGPRSPRGFHARPLLERPRLSPSLRDCSSGRGACASGQLRRVSVGA